MSFKPYGTIYLCNVAFDNSYKHQIYFQNEEQQEAYFKGRKMITLSEYNVVRRTSPTGGLSCSLKVEKPIDTLYPCNYMMFQNAEHSNRYFYAFITQLEYINEETTEIHYELDVYQTWRFAVELGECFVVREHSVRDGIGDNVVPESFNFQDYFYTKFPDGSTSLGDYGYLVASTESYNDTGTEEHKNARGKVITGIYQGLFFFYFKNSSSLDTFLDNVDKDCIVSISVIPEFSVSSSMIGENLQGEGMIFGSKETPSRDFLFTMETFRDFQGYIPKNNKLFTAPFFKFIVTNNGGMEAEYNTEDFTNRNNIVFTAYGDISVSPSLTLIPKNYKGVEYHYTSGISIKSFPQCSYNADTFKLWLAKNQYGAGLSALTGVASIIGGAVAIASGVGAGAGVGMIGGGAVAVANSINGVYQASQEPNRGQAGAVQNNLLTAMGRNKFDFYVKQIKREYAEIIDNYFTMYGYAVNKFKIPNVSGRPCYNYVQTMGCNLIGSSIPGDDLRKLKSIYDSGITLWKPDAPMGLYSVCDNSAPIKG